MTIKLVGPMQDLNTLATCVAPEDVRYGDYVAVLSEVIEYPSFLWFDRAAETTHDLVRIRFCSPEGGIPLKVKGICLPFVFVTTPQGTPRTLDLRRVQLARLSRTYAKTVWKSLRGQQRHVLDDVCHS